MCLGLPMTIIACDGVSATVRRADEVRRVSVMLIGFQPPGTHVLVHIDNAVRVLDPVEADAIDRAIEGLGIALDGGDFTALFADLIDREPELPPHLRGAA